MIDNVSQEETVVKQSSSLFLLCSLVLFFTGLLAFFKAKTLAKYILLGLHISEIDAALE